MRKLATLENTSLPELCDAFNSAFSDYFIPLHLDAEKFKTMLQSDRYKPEFSAAAFLNEQPVAFILHGTEILNGVLTAYNCGTGVIPAQRGNKLTEQLYDFILPKLRDHHFKKSVLEVITENTKAIHVYNKIGFSISRLYNCYRGHPTPKKHHYYKVESISTPDWQSFASFRDWNPSWQNSDKAVQTILDKLQVLGIREQEQVVAYMVFDPRRARVMQFAVHPGYRRKGYGSALFHYVHSTSQSEITCINIDAASASTVAFMEATGFSLLLRQHEMELEL